MSPGKWLVTGADRLAPHETIVLHFPYAGGHAASFQAWSEDLGPGRRYVGVEPPGRGARFGEAFANSVDEIADSVVGELLGLPDHRLALFGHSMGALVAYEVTVRLESLGRAVLALVVSGQRAPHDGPGHLRLTDLTEDGLFVSRLAALDFLDATMFAHPELFELFTPVLRADVRITEDYPWGRAEPVAAAVTALAGDADPVLPPEALEHWRQIAPNGFRSAVVPGGHMFVKSSADVVAQELRGALDRQASPL